MQSKSFEWADFMTKVLQTAGNEIIKLRNELRVEVTYKSAGELVTTADLASNQIIHKAISSVIQNIVFSQKSRPMKTMVKKHMKAPYGLYTH